MAQVQGMDLPSGITFHGGTKAGGEAWHAQKRKFYKNINEVRLSVILTWPQITDYYTIYNTYGEILRGNMSTHLALI